MDGARSAPTDRVLDVLEFLARPGASRPRFSDVVRELGLTQGTAHAILTTLANRGWITRDPTTKTFTPGPALAVVAAQLDATRPLASLARAAAVQLAAATGYSASVVERVGDALLMTAFIDGDDRYPAGTPGSPIPYVPPFGVAIAAWDSPDEQRAWMQRATTPDTTLTDRLRQLLERTRSRGYDVDRTTPALAQAAQAIGTIHTDELPEPVRNVLGQLLIECTTAGLLAEDDPRAAQPVATIAAPVFDRHHQAGLILAVHPLRALDAGRIAEVGRLVTAAAAGLNP